MRLFFRKERCSMRNTTCACSLLLSAAGNALRSNDLDTLLASFLAARLRREEAGLRQSRVLHRSAGVGGRPRRPRVWLAIERWIFPSCEHVITVNDSIARLTICVMGTRSQVVRNIPMQRDLGPLPSREGTGPSGGPLHLVLQGSRHQRAARGEEAVLAMRNCRMPAAVRWRGCLARAGTAGEGAPTGGPRALLGMPYERMMQYTRNADLGLSLDKDTNLNYRFSLPNKLFDYLMRAFPCWSRTCPKWRALCANSMRVWC
jgi:hypothetical protein